MSLARIAGWIVGHGRQVHVFGVGHSCLAWMVGFFDPSRRGVCSAHTQRYAERGVTVETVHARAITRSLEGIQTTADDADGALSMSVCTAAPRLGPTLAKGDAAGRRAEGPGEPSGRREGSGVRDEVAVGDRGVRSRGGKSERSGTAGAFGGASDAPGAKPERGAVERILARISAEHGARDVDRYFEGDVRIETGREGLSVTVPNEFAAQMLDKRFGRSLRDAAMAELIADQAAAHGVEVRFRVDREAFRQAGPGPDVKGSDPVPPRHARRPRARTAPANRYRLDDFLVGESNRLAYGAAMVLLEPHDETKGPLFVHGVCGVGKTHLLHGLAARYAEVHRGARVCCTTGEAFTNAFVMALKSQGVEAFRKAHRGLDLLCIDDVHLIAGKTATQTELLHTFDALNLDGAKIVLASDGHPRQTTSLGQGLISRFLAGAVIRIDAPDAALCARLIERQVAMRGLPIEPRAIDAIATRIASLTSRSVRDIEGAVTQVEAVWRTMPELRTQTGAIGTQVIDRALGAPGIASRIAPRRAVRAEHVVEAVCRALSVEPSAMGSSKRHPRVVFARAVATYLSREITTASFPEIARAIGRPTHSTVVAADKRLRQRLEESPGLDLGEQFDGLTVRGVCARIAEDLGRQGQRTTP